MTWLQTLRALSGSRLGTKIAWLMLSLAAGLMFWRIAGDMSMRIGPDAALMEHSADLMRRASDVIRAARGPAAAGDEPAEGSAYRLAESGDSQAAVASPRGKRTVANPDTAAVFSRQLRKAGLQPGDTVAVVLSDAYIGGDVAALSAIEAYGLRSRVVSVLHAPPAGVTENRAPFTWLDAEAAVRSAGVWNVRSLRVMLMGDERNAGYSGIAVREAMFDAIRRSGVPPIAADDLAGAVRESAAILDLGANAATRPALLVNLGGSRLALGDCLQAQDLPHGVITRPLPCRGGVPGLIAIALDQGVPVLNAFVVRE